MKCVRCGAKRGKWKWHKILIGGRARLLCPGCMQEWIEAAEIHNKQMLQWLDGTIKFYETKPASRAS